MELRDYQKECLNEIEKLPKGSRSVVALATGLGKSLTGARIPFKKRMLWISHRDELVRQPERYFVEQGLTYGIEKSSETSEGEQVVSASIQSLARSDRYKKFAPDEFDVVVCDEAHHAAAPTYQKVLSYFKPDKLIGLTATPKRGDGVRLTDVFDTICFSRDLKWGIKHGYLSRIRCVQVQSDYDMAKLKKQAGDFSLASMEATMEVSDDDMIVTRAYHDFCLPEDRQTLIYCPTVKVCEAVAKTMRKSLPGKEDTIRVLSQKCSDEERKEILDGYKDGSIRCIVNCMILTEGTDLPATSAIINNRPSCNESLYSQIIGRGSRLSEGKEYCLIVDVVGENYIKKKVCTAPTLFGIEPEFLTPKMRKEMENEDLLDFSDALAGMRAENAKLIKYRIQVIDLFADELQDIIDSNRANGMKAIADGYRRHVDSAGEEYDFGDIIVRKTPDSERYFDIYATWDGHIYISKPDMLDKVTLEVSIPPADGLENGIFAKSSPITMEEAVSKAHDILEYLIPNRFRPKWSKNANQAYAERECSPKQYGRCCIQAENWDAFTPASLTMLQASDLIDLDCEINALNEKKHELQKRQREIGRDKYAPATDVKQEEFAPLESMEPLIQNAKRLVEEAKKKLSETSSISVRMDYTYFKTGHTKLPSIKQRDFIDSLVDGLKRKGIKFDHPFSSRTLDSIGLDMAETGFIINALLTVQRSPITTVKGATVCISEYASKCKGLDGESLERPAFTEVRCKTA